MDSTDVEDQLLVPYDKVRHKLGNIGRTKLDELFHPDESGQPPLVRVKIGRRGFVTAKSLAAYVDRLAGAAQGTRS